MTVALFIPCFIDQGAPQVARATVALLERLGVAWHYPEAQTCCGQFAYTNGDFATARRLKRHFQRVFASAATIVCPSASCTFMVRQGYPKLAQDEEQEPSRERLAARTWELGEWLAAWGPFPWTPQFEGALVLHQSCKARRLGILPQVRKILAQAPGLKVLEVPPYFSCCGFGGLFKFQHPHLARDIGSAYLEAVAATGAAGMVSPDFSCLMHLREIAQQEGLKLAFFHPAEVLL